MHCNDYKMLTKDAAHAAAGSRQRRSSTGMFAVLDARMMPGGMKGLDAWPQGMGCRIHRQLQGRALQRTGRADRMPQRGAARRGCRAGVQCRLLPMPLRRTTAALLHFLQLALPLEARQGATAGILGVTVASSAALETGSEVPGCTAGVPTHNIHCSHCHPCLICTTFLCTGNCRRCPSFQLPCLDAELC